MVASFTVFALILAGIAAAARYLISKRDAREPNPDSPLPHSVSLGSEEKIKSIYHANKDKGTYRPWFCTPKSGLRQNRLVAGDPNFVPDPKPLLDFNLKTARTRDYVYVNKTLR